MDVKKITIGDKKFTINLKFYFLLKHLVKTNLTEKQVEKTFSICQHYKNKSYLSTVEAIQKYILTIKGQKKKDNFALVIEQIQNNDDLLLFLFSLKLFLIKDLLLAEAKLKNIMIKEKLATLPPLSLEYDQLSLFTPYSTRVNGALLALAFFSFIDNEDTDFLSTDSTVFLQQLVKSAKQLQKKGLEANQIFMLIFNESINQSIISESGINYEERILSVLTDEMGISSEDIQKKHDDNDASTEYDFFFRINNRSYGISAKKTLRERYKQFIKTANTTPIDIMIEITLGVDLTLEKAKIIRNHDVYIFVADEVYAARKDLQKLEGVYSVVSFTKRTLLNL